MECPSDEALLAMVQGNLGGEMLPGLDVHLDSCESCRDAVVVLARASAGESVTRSGVTRAGGAALDEELAPGRGTVIGRFVVIDTLGHGAMGIVLRAYDPELDRKVALKLLRADHTGDPAEARGRLVREAQAMARLSHPNVVTVYEVGTWRDAVFVAMELVDGVSLREWLASGGAQRDVRALISVLAQAGEGLVAAHAAGLVHRDFKPDNVIVGSDGRARVTDFGLAGMNASAASAEALEPAMTGDVLGSPVTTRTGALLGTPAYMAPEQLAGRPADARSDQFAFGVTLHEAVHGTRPFAGRTLRELRASIESGRWSGESRARASAKVASVIRRALAARADDRFPSMRALLDALAPARKANRWAIVAVAALASALAIAGVSIFAMRTATPACDDGAATAASIVRPDVLATIRGAMGGVDTSGSLARTVTTRLERWAARFAGAHDDACRATRVDGTQSESVMDARMACLARHRVDAEAIVAELARGEASSALRATELSSALPDVTTCDDVQSLAAVVPMPSDAGRRAQIEALRGRLAALRAEILAARGPVDVEVVARHLVADADATRYPPVGVEARLVLVAALRTSGLAEQAEQVAREASIAAETSRDDAGAARAWVAIVGIQGERGRYEEAARSAEHARAAVARAGSPAEIDASLANVVGVANEALGRYDDAERALARALELRRRVLGPSDPEVARVLTNLGNVARGRGRLEDALRLHREALAIDRAALGERHPAVARHEHNLGGVLRLMGRPSEALEHYRRALAIREATLGGSHADTAITQNSLGLVNVDLGRTAEARRYLELAVGTLAAAHHAEEAVARHNLGLLDQQAGNHAAAVAQLTRALSLEERLLGDRHEKVATLSLELAESLAALGRWDEARIALSRAETIGVQANRAELVARARGLSEGVTARERAAPAARPAPPRSRAQGSGPRPEPTPALPPQRTRPEPPGEPTPSHPPSRNGLEGQTRRVPVGGSTYTPGRAW